MSTHEYVLRSHYKFRVGLRILASSESTSGTVTATFGRTVTLHSAHIFNTALLEDSIQIVYEEGTGFAIEWLETPAGTIRTASSTGTASGILEFDDLQWLLTFDSVAESVTMSVRWSQAHFLVDGTTVSTWSGAEFVCNGIAPGYMPFQAIQISAECSTNITSGGTSWTTENGIEFRGGYQFKDTSSSSWTTHPVALPVNLPAWATFVVADDSWNCGGEERFDQSTTDGEVFFTLVVQNC